MKENVNPPPPKFGAHIRFGNEKGVTHLLGVGLTREEAVKNAMKRVDWAKRVRHLLMEADSTKIEVTEVGDKASLPPLDNMIPDAGLT